MLPISPQRLLSVWEQGERLHPIDRTLMLFALARPELEPEKLPELPLGTCHAALLNLQRESFNRHLPAWVNCLNCGERMEFDLDSMQFPPPTDENLGSIEVNGLLFRIPNSRDLARIAEFDADPECAGEALFLELAEQPRQLPENKEELEALRQEVEAAVEKADPWVNISLALQCPVCGHDDQAEFDIANYLWDAIDCHAQRLLDEIHDLARAYGWSEAEILALSDARRRSYLHRLFS